MLRSLSERATVAILFDFFFFSLSLCLRVLNFGWKGK